jgi:hypothetical protein
LSLLFSSLFQSRLDLLCEAQFRELVKLENDTLALRVHKLLRNCSHEVAQLKMYNESVFLSKLEEWLGLRIQGESAAIDTLSFIFKVWLSLCFSALLCVPLLVCCLFSTFFVLISCSFFLFLPSFPFLTLSPSSECYRRGQEPQASPSALCSFLFALHRVIAPEQRAEILGQSADSPDTAVTQRNERRNDRHE